MIITLFAWIYITCVCVIWGNIIMAPVIKKNISPAGEPALPFSFLSGLAVVGILGVWMSIFMPLALTAHIVILLPALLYFLMPGNRKNLFRQFNTQFKSLSHLQWLIFSACVLLVLFISTYLVNHPDTLIYHAQSIHWMETYKAIPGKVHLHPMLGTTSMWFAINAIFRFDFIHPNNFLFVNGAVLCWFCLFLCTSIGAAYKKAQENNQHFIPRYLYWVLLLVFCFACWTQIRLTAASASPDFIAAIYIWAALYAFSKNRSGDNGAYLLQGLLFCCAAITVKLSAIAIAILLIFLLYRAFNRRRIIVGWLSITGVALAILPCLIRNTIETGYPLFPSAVLSMPGADWKLSAENTHVLEQYITAYARFPVDSYDSALKAMQLSPAQWLPLWWRILDLPNQLLLITIGALLLWNLVTFKKQIARRGFSELVILAVTLAGSVFWLLKAPAPRFGTSFLIPLAYTLSTGIPRNERLGERLNRPTIYKTTLIAISIMLIAYSGYRAVLFFTPIQLVLPQGVQQSAYKEISCKGLKLYLSDQCGFNCAPCVPDSCSSFTPRGTEIISGFRQK